MDQGLRVDIKQADQNLKVVQKFYVLSDKEQMGQKSGVRRTAACSSIQGQRFETVCVRIEDYGSDILWVIQRIQIEIEQMCRDH